MPDPHPTNPDDSAPDSGPRERTVLCVADTMHVFGFTCCFACGYMQVLE